MTDLTQDERALLRRMGGWPIADLLLDPRAGAEHMRTSRWGGTYRDHGFFQCERRGVELYDYATNGHMDAEAMQAARDDVELVRHTILLLRWPKIAAYARTLPADVLAELRVARVEQRRAWLDVIGLTPPPGKRAPQRPAGEQEHAYAAHRAASERLDRALAAALPTDAFGQLDLFDLAVSA